jgi:hypothetical protein
MVLPTNKHPSAPNKENPDATVVSETSADGSESSHSAAGDKDQYATLACSNPQLPTEQSPPDASLGTLALSSETPLVESPPDCTIPLPGSSAPANTASDATCVLSDEDEVGHAAPDTCHLTSADALPPTEHLGRREATIGHLEQTLNLPGPSLSPRQAEPSGTEVIDPPSRDGTQVLSSYERQEEDPLHQTLQEPAAPQQLPVSFSRASAWLKAVPEDRQPRYHEAAWCLAQCAARTAKQGKDAEPLARRAIELLRQAAGQGFADARFLSKQEFDVLRERADFKQVESSLGKPK